MHNTDIILLIPLILGTLRGFYKGFIAEITSLVTLFVACYFSFKYYGVFAHYINSNIRSRLPSVYISIAAFTILFLLAYIILYAISIKIERLTAAIHLTSINHVAGAAFGLIKWAFMISVFIALLITFGYKVGITLMQFNHTWLYDHIQMLAPDIMPNLFGRGRH